MPRRYEFTTARDGTRLATDVYLPAERGPFPTILQRTPYGKLAERYGAYAQWCAAHGYAAVVQDVRGRHDSDGTWTPYDNHEDTDGYDRAAAVLAGALLAPTGEEGTVDDAVTAGFGAEELGLVTIEPTSDSEPLVEATLAVVVAGPPPEDDVDRRNGVLRGLVSHLDAAGAGGVVGGGPSSSGDDGLLTAIRTDTDVSEAVSTVDSVDLASGQVTVVFAAVEQEQGGSGSYGKVGTTDGPLPPDVLAEPAEPSEPSDQPTGEGESSP